MKTILLSTTLLACSLTSMAAIPADTVKVVNKPSKVVITEDSLGSHVTVFSDEKIKTEVYNYDVAHAANDKVQTSQSKDLELKLPFFQSDSTKKNWDVHIGLAGAYLGFGWMSNSSDPVFNAAKGHTKEWGFVDLFGIRYAAKDALFRFSIGISGATYNIHDKGYHFAKAGDVVSVTAFPEGNYSNKSSNMSLFNWDFSLTYRQKFYKDLAFFVTPMLSVNARARINTKYRLDDTFVNQSTKNIGVRKMSFGLMGGLIWDGLGVYVHYRPQTIFKNGMGPDFKTKISAGIIALF